MRLTKMGTEMDWNLKGGVIVIGSLLWQDHLDKPNDNIRANWRNTHLKIQDKIAVKVPIRYGRISTKSGNSIVTMVFSNKMKKRMGFGYVIPFAQPILNSASLLSECTALCRAEGMKDEFVVSWGVLGYMLNEARLANIDVKGISKVFRDKLNSKIDVKDYKVGREKSCVTSSLKLSIPWIEPVSGNDNDKINEFDFLLATATKPSVPSPSITAIAQLIKADTQRKYFLNNLKNGIITQEDFQIVQHLSSKNS